MGRKKKGAVDDSEFSVDKDEMLEVFEKKENSVLTKDVIAKYEMKPVGQLKALSSPMTWFTGKSYDESLKLAYEWAQRFNTRKDATSQVELTAYYPQVHKGKNIIVSYKVV